MFPLTHLKKVQYLHSVQLAVAQLHQNLESEKLERQAFQLVVLYFQIDIVFIQNILANQSTGTPAKPFSIDLPNVDRVMNPWLPEIYELWRVAVYRFIVMGNSKTLT